MCIATNKTSRRRSPGRPGAVGAAVAVLLALVKPLGMYMTRVYTMRPCGLDWLFGNCERFIYRASGIDMLQDMTGVPTVATLPMWWHHGLPEEDGVYPSQPVGI